MRLHHVQPAHDRSLVIRRPTTVQLSGAVGVRGELEGRVEPAVLLQCGLDIVVTVDEQGFLIVSSKVSLRQGPERGVELTFLGSLPS